MDLRAVRKDLAVVAGNLDINAWSYQPDDPENYPAAVVGGLEQLVPLTATIYKFQLGVTLYANAADAEDATSTLDLWLSAGTEGSFQSALDWLSNEDNAYVVSWRSIRFVSAGTYQMYSMPGGLSALGCKLTYELTA